MEACKLLMCSTRAVSVALTPSSFSTSSEKVLSCRMRASRVSVARLDYTQSQEGLRTCLAASSARFLSDLVSFSMVMRTDLRRASTLSLYSVSFSSLSSVGR